MCDGENMRLWNIHSSASVNARTWMHSLFNSEMDELNDRSSYLPRNVCMVGLMFNFLHHTVRLYNVAVSLHWLLGSKAVQSKVDFKKMCIVTTLRRGIWHLHGNKYSDNGNVKHWVPHAWGIYIYRDSGGKKSPFVIRTYDYAKHDESKAKIIFLRAYPPESISSIEIFAGMLLSR